MSANLDMSSFNRTLAEYMAKCPHTLTEIVNKKMYFVLKGAWERTPKVERSQIERDMNVIATKLKRSRKTGKLGRGRMVIGATSLLYAIVNARRGKAGVKGLYGKEMDRAARKILNARIRAAGTARRGWLKSLLAFAAKTRDSVPGGAIGKLPAGKGTAKVAEPGWNPQAQATYEVTIDSGKGGRIDPRVEAALAASFAAEEASMREYIEKKIQEEIDRSMR